MTYHARGKLEEAEKLGEEVVLLCKQVIGEHHPHTIASMSNLASIYHTRGKLQEANQLKKQVLLLST
ncbi:hypothetical protein GYMLUDRAFT_696694 [Collybiopsis luxurians FD-317 M1]|uniref:Kinesin light chain n=1 Tax=Collybiopsis luxurians FD-317 M1 TaxID=944289 RepID=A0A0D0CJE1_9AGAR|nr:hypothetical protein GYMLUDRAFT_696694 [Collybiopsis luxurians FD-317 M1]